MNGNKESKQAINANIYKLLAAFNVITNNSNTHNTTNNTNTNINNSNSNINNSNSNSQLGYLVTLKKYKNNRCNKYNADMPHPILPQLYKISINNNDSNNNDNISC